MMVVKWKSFILVGGQKANQAVQIDFCPPQVRELDQDGAEVSLVDHDQVIKALSADRANEPLDDRIRARGPKGCSDASDAQLA